ncbi:hypothetical protein HDV01_007372 [Terramyces sp. JEL0728]|nr:hypothetical protein HDV01_007372 [Terramyces sp. JEL0728]
MKLTTLCLAFHVQAQLFGGSNGNGNSNSNSNSNSIFGGVFGNSNSNSNSGNSNSGNSNSGNSNSGTTTTTNNGVQIVNTNSGNTGTTGQTVDQGTDNTGTGQDNTGQGTTGGNTQNGGTDGATGQGSTQVSNNITVTTTARAPKATANVTVTTIVSPTATTPATAAASSSAGNNIGTMAGIVGGIVGSIVLLFAIGSFLRYMQLERENQEQEKMGNRLTLQLKADLEAPVEHPPAVAVYEDWTLDRGTLRKQEEEYYSITESYYATSENELLSDSRDALIPPKDVTEPAALYSVPKDGTNERQSALSAIYNDIIVTEQELTKNQSSENSNSQIPELTQVTQEPGAGIAAQKEAKVTRPVIPVVSANSASPKSPLVDVPKAIIQEKKSPSLLVAVPKAIVQEAKPIVPASIPIPAGPKAPVILPARKSSKNILVDELPPPKVESELKDKPLPPVVELASPAPSVETDITPGERRPSALSIVYDGILDEE